MVSFLQQINMHNGLLYRKKVGDHFKKNMNFKYIPLQEHYVWNPTIRPLLSWIPQKSFHGLYGMWQWINRKSD